MKYEVSEQNGFPRVEGTAEGQEPEVTVFYGPNGKDRAEFYGKFITAYNQLDPDDKESFLWSMAKRYDLSGNGSNYDASSSGSATGQTLPPVDPTAGVGGTLASPLNSLDESTIASQESQQSADGQYAGNPATTAAEGNS